jgi:hypothetical protein
MKVVSLISILISILLISSCKKEEEQLQTKAPMAEVGHKIIAEEVIQAGSYTYIKAKEGEESYWVAVTKRDVQEGTTLYYQRGMEMKNFESKDLDRTFESILFVDQMSTKPFEAAGMAEAADAHKRSKSAEKLSISVPPSEDGISIGELYADKLNYKDRMAIISGKVTKFNAGIMGRNWVHIQDGSEANGKFDLTITTDETVSVGDIVTFSGKIALDKDFGAGYAYEVIMENATITN